jgi:REP element-mobilizing transposase RayT
MPNHIHGIIVINDRDFGKCEGEEAKCTDQGVKCRGEGVECRDQVVKCRGEGVKCRDQVVKCRDQVVKCRGEVTSPLHLTNTSQNVPSKTKNLQISTQQIKRPTLGQIIAYFKYQSTKNTNQYRRTPGVKIWQRNYYERVIRNGKELNRIQKYIIENPRHWEI